MNHLYLTQISFFVQIVHYEKYSYMSKTEIRRRLKSDEYLDADVAVKCGLVDEIWGQNK